MQGSVLTRDRSLSRIRPARWPQRTVLGALADSTREDLLALGRFREYSAGSTLIMEGDASTESMVLIDGWVKVMGVTQVGGQSLLALHGGGDIVGEHSALTNRPRTASVISAGGTAVCVIRQDDFLRFFAARPDFALALCRGISEKLTWSTCRLIDFGGLPVRLRVARVLGELAQLYGRLVGDRIVFDYALTQMELAAMVGASEAGAFRALRELRVAGMIGTGYRRVMITDLPALLAAAGMDALAISERQTAG